MSIRKGPTEGGSGGRRGHSGIEQWGFTDEFKEAAKKRRRLDDTAVIDEEAKEPVVQPSRKKRSSS